MSQSRRDFLKMLGVVGTVATVPAPLAAAAETLAPIAESTQFTIHGLGAGDRVWVAIISGAEANHKKVYEGTVYNDGSITLDLPICQEEAVIATRVRHPGILPFSSLQPYSDEPKFIRAVRIPDKIYEA